MLNFDKVIDYLTKVISSLQSLIIAAVRPSVALLLKGERQIVQQRITAEITVGSTTAPLQGNNASLSDKIIHHIEIEYQNDDNTTFDAAGLNAAEITVFIQNTSSVNVLQGIPAYKFIDSDINSVGISSTAGFYFGTGGLDKQIIINDKVNFSSSGFKFPPAPNGGTITVSVYYYA